MLFLAAILTIVDETGKKVAGALVTFISAQGALSVAHSDAAGIANAPEGFNALRARISAPGYRTQAISIAAVDQRVVLVRSLPVIGSVRVATGSMQTLHELPVAATALDRAAITASGALTTDGLLRQLPGFDRSRSNSMFTNYGQLRVSFAGAGNDRGLVLVDGVPAQDGFGGQIDWAAYPPGNLERAELLAGAGSALYGAGAVGGVLDLQTYAPNSDASAPPDSALTFEAGTSAYNRQWTNARAALSPRLTAAVSTQQTSLQYFDLPPDYQSPIDRVAQSDASMASLRLRYAAGSNDAFEIGERGAWDDQFEGRPNYTFSRRLNQTDARYTHHGARSLVQTTLFSRTTFIVNVADQFPNKPGVLRYVQDVPTNEDGVSASWVSGGDPSTFELRADARHVHGQTVQYGPGGIFQNSGSGTQNLGGVAAQEMWKVRRFEAVAGARLDSVTSLVSPNRTDSAISPRAAFRFDASPRFALRASSGGGFRPPYLNELVRGFFIGNVSYGPNPSLVPERSRTNSAGVDYGDSLQRASLDAFDTNVGDAIMFRTLDPTHQIRSNIARTRTDGYILTYTRSLGACARLATWFSSQNARVTSGPIPIIAKSLQYVPRQSASVAYTGQIGSTGVGLSATYTGQTYADDLNVQPLGSATILGASVRVPVEGAMLALSADNLAGARYLSSIDRYGPPAVISLGLSLPVGPSQTQAAAACLPQ